jgi:hypothetical protein
MVEDELDRGHRSGVDRFSNEDIIYHMRRKDSVTARSSPLTEIL